MNVETKSSKRLSYVIRAAIYIVVGLGFGFAEHIWYVWSERPCDAPDRSFDSALVSRSFYTYLTTLGWRKPENQYSTVISVREDREPKELFESYCNHREFLGRLITEVRRHDPISIVVDNYISNHNCPIDEQFEKILMETNVPVVLGQHTLNHRELEHLLQRPLTEGESKSFRQACLVVNDNLDLGPAKPHVLYGLLRFNADTSKLPLSWPVFPTPATIATPDATIEIKTLAAQAASTIPELQIPDLKTHPYTSFLRESDIRSLSALQVLCASYDAKTGWRDCSNPGDKFDSQLRHHIVFIGDDTNDDQHETPVGSMPGVFLHANYLESLAGKRFFRPIGQRWQIIWGVVWLGFVEFAYVRTRKPLIGLAVSFGGTVLLWVACALAATLTGILPVIWVPGALALILRFFEGIREELMEEK